MNNIEHEKLFQEMSSLIPDFQLNSRRSFQNLQEDVETVDYSITPDYLKKNFGSYAKVYHEAALNLLEILCNSLKSEESDYEFEADLNGGNYDILPIMFLFCHALELYLKSIIHRGNSLARKINYPLPSSSITHHELEKLFDIVLTILEMIKDEFEQEDRWNFHQERSLDSTERFPSEQECRNMLKELDDLKFCSYAFRYPLTTKDEPHLPQNHIISVSQLELISNLLRYLEWRDYGIAVLDNLDF